MFVSRTDRHVELNGFDDPRLRHLKIGVQMIGDDFSNTPPAHALTNRGMVENVRGFMVYGDYASDSPARPIVDAVSDGDIDVAIVWGPVAGYFAATAAHSLRLQPVAPLIDGPTLPMMFDISMGVSKDNRALRREIDASLDRNRPAIRAVLAKYHVPTIDPT
jgi:mxaJ protein